MIVLDENILEGQRLQLEAYGTPASQVGVDAGRKGMKDDEVIVLLRKLKNATFFTRDFGFYRRDLCHSRYCLVVLNVAQNEAATFIRRLQRHPNFATKVKRIGSVVRVSHSGLGASSVMNAGSLAQSCL